MPTRKEIIRDIFQEAKEAGFTAQSYSKHDILLQPRTDEQYKIAQQIQAKYEVIGFIEGNVLNVGVRKLGAKPKRRNWSRRK